MTKMPKTTYPGARLEILLHERLSKELLKELNLGNINEVPKLEKIVVSVGLGKTKEDKKAIEVATNTLAKITGLRPIQTTARMSVANFKLREGQVIGLKVTLRGTRMYEFADRLFSLTLPRLRDFHGLKLGAFDKQGNYNLGLVDQSAFAELSFEETAHPHGLQVTFCLDTRGQEHSLALLAKLGMPFEKPHEEPLEKIQDSSPEKVGE